MKKLSLNIIVFSAAVSLFPYAVFAQEGSGNTRSDSPVSNYLTFQQDNPSPAARQVDAAIERAVRRFRIGVQAGVGLDPELIMFGAHGAFGPFFNQNVEFRPGFEIGLGELTTVLGINLDVMYMLPGGGARWTPYVGAGPNFALSHRGFETEDDLVDDDDNNRFDFSDTDFEGGFNFFAGARNANGMFLEMKATAYGVTNIRFLVGYNF